MTRVLRLDRICLYILKTSYNQNIGDYVYSKLCLHIPNIKKKTDNKSTKYDLGL